MICNRIEGDRCDQAHPEAQTHIGFDHIGIQRTDGNLGLESCIGENEIDRIAACKGCVIGQQRVLR